MLIAENSLVLRPVIGEKALDVLHMRDQRHVDQQDDDLRKAFGEIPDQIALGQRLDGRHNEGRQKDEQEHAQCDAEHHRHIDDELLGLLGGEVLRDPLVDLVRLLLLLQREGNDFVALQMPRKDAAGDRVALQTDHKIHDGCAVADLDRLLRRNGAEELLGEKRRFIRALYKVQSRERLQVAKCD